MRKYKIVRYKDCENWFVFKRYLLFFWKRVTYFDFINFERAVDYVLKHNNSCVIVEVGKENIPEYIKK